MEKLKRKKRNSIIFMLTGLLLIAAALVITWLNMWEQRSAGVYSDYARDKVVNAINDEREKADPDDEPPYIRNPDMEMPVVTVDGMDYIGVLSVPVLGLELPILSEWSYPNLKKTPCRFSGSAYLDDLILLGHNYTTHFGKLRRLKQGDTLIFTDAVGNVFNYEVVDQEILEPTMIKDLKAGDWDLTLFTCTLGGRTRVTVRCDRIKD